MSLSSLTIRDRSSRGVGEALKLMIRRQKIGFILQNGQAKNNCNARVDSFATSAALHRNSASGCPWGAKFAKRGGSARDKRPNRPG